MIENSDGIYYSKPMQGKGVSIIIGKRVFLFGYARHNGSLKNFEIGIITKEPVGEDDVGKE